MGCRSETELMRCPALEEYLQRHGQLWLVVLCTAAFLLTWLAPVCLRRLSLSATA